MRKKYSLGKRRSNWFSEGVKTGVRYQLGCTQDELSGFLGLATSNLALVETDQRSLPRAAKAKRTNLLKWIAEADAAPTIVPELNVSELEDLRMILKRRAGELQLRLMDDNDKLSAMRRRYEMHMSAINRLTTMQKIEWGMALSPFPEWTRGLIARNRLGLIKCGIALQYKLQMKIAANQGELNVLSGFISELDAKLLPSI